MYVKENSTREALEMKTAVDDVIEGANLSTHVHAESYVSRLLTIRIAKYRVTSGGQAPWLG